jgi:hypothetical protein
MRIHTDNITWAEIREAGVLARVDFTKIKEHGSKQRDHAFHVVLAGASHHRQNMGGSGYAATWDQWGVFLGALFAIDPEMTCVGGGHYKNEADFDYKTGARFADGWPEDAHGDHSWVVGVPLVQTCRRCTAEKRWGN